MKKTIAAVATLLLLQSGTLLAQQTAEPVLTSPCDDIAIQKKVDSLKKILARDGFSVLREASMTMQSEDEIPIIIPMDQGSLYQFVFIGDVKSNQWEVKMYDYNERQVVYQKKSRGEVDGNIISYSYIPRMSDYHMIKPLQINQQIQKELCGYVLLFKKDTGLAKTAK